VVIGTNLPSSDNTLRADKQHGWYSLPSNEALFWSDERYLVKGRLYYSPDRSKYIDFEKEIVAKQK
jgi:hypothetical protein